jgi:Transposase IS200 like
MAKGRRAYGPDRVRGAGPAASFTQRGNRREPVFFGAEDYRFYRRLISAAARRAGAEIWAYCLMPNHVHLIVTPAERNGLRRTFGEARRRYTGAINARVRWTGHLFQGPFGAVVMDEPPCWRLHATSRSIQWSRGW